MDQKDGLGHADTADLINPDREGIEPELGKKFISAWMDGARILIRRELEARAIDNERFLQLRKQKHAAQRRLRRGGQETVVAAGIETGDGGRRESADPIGFEP